MHSHDKWFPVAQAAGVTVPAGQVEANLSNRNVNFADEGYDLAIRGRIQPDSGLVARKLEDAGLVVVAAPSYLQRAGLPASLEALQQHDCIQFLLPSSGQKIPWLFSHDGQALDVATTGGYCCSEDLLGGGICRCGCGCLLIFSFRISNIDRFSSHGGSASMI